MRDHAFNSAEVKTMTEPGFAFPLWMRSSLRAALAAKGSMAAAGTVVNTNAKLRIRVPKFHHIGLEPPLKTDEPFNGLLESCREEI